MSISPSTGPASASEAQTTRSKPFRGRRGDRASSALSVTCRRVIREPLPRLEAEFARALTEQPTEVWGLGLAEDDPDQQTLLFRYPAGGRPTRRAGRPTSGRWCGLNWAQCEHWPATDASVTPYAAEEFPDVFKTGSCSVHVLAAERTFWEKATLLHMWYHAPARQEVSGSPIAALLALSGSTSTVSARRR